MKALLGLLGVLTAFPLLATTVGTTCYPAPTAPHYGFLPSTYVPPSISSGCLGTDPATGAKGMATASVTSTIGAGGDFTKIHLAEEVYTSFGLYAGPVSTGVSGQASSLIDYSDTFITSGPVRSGYMSLSGTTTYASPYDGSVSQSFSMTPLNPNLPTPQMVCDQGGCNIGYYASHPLVPVMLGTSFTITDCLALTAGANFEDGISGGSLTTDIQFRFFEADGVTPAAVSEAPEPATFALLGLPLAVALIAKRNR